METVVIKLNKNNLDMDKIRFAAEVIKGGGLVAFPTETVYGLGADALNECAVEKIFKAKGRPPDNPLIVHIADTGMLGELTAGMSADACKLMDSFWPGPLTLVMFKSNAVPQIITAGLNTVAIRIPSHPVALALIKECGLPIAAPSANISGGPSPTSAKHVIDDLSGKVDVVIDAGPARVGLESTVLDITVKPPVILRPGGVTPAQLKEVLGKVVIDPALTPEQAGILKPKSPGMKYTHYSPRADVIVIEGELKKVVDKANEMAASFKSKGITIGILATDQTWNLYNCAEIISMGDRDKPDTIAASLFKALRELDGKNVRVILAEAIDDTGIGLAVMNRMSKAAGGNVIRV